MLRITQLKIHPGHTPEQLEQKICKYLHIPQEHLLEYKIRKQSIDARKKPEIIFSYVIDVKVTHERSVKKHMKNNVQEVEETFYEIPSGKSKDRRPVVIGSGPAGLFCAYLLASAGLKPVLLERGCSVEERIQDVENFWKTGKLNTKSNVQFGEGGAGTFSDGKLNTLVKDKSGRNHFVLETFVKFGAPENILYEQKPHIGTDILIDVVANMRNAIIELGGKIRFNSLVTDILIENNAITGVVINNQETLATHHVVLAVGHSARDTFAMLLNRKIPMQAKSFAVGVRIEHPQDMINFSQYGGASMENLPTASYKLTAKLADGRGAYTFCMCPGGYVVNASSEENRLAVNGMSYHGRDGQNANSAVIVTVTPDDFADNHPLAGVEFQRTLEENAFKAGEGKVPVQCFGDFCQNKVTEKLGDVIPQIKGAYKLANVRAVFPESLACDIEKGIRLMDDKIHGFAREDCIVSGVESRTSSPVKIMRDETFQSEVRGLYPCGEGAGYAGGITSAAMDGMKVAEALIKAD